MFKPKHLAWAGLVPGLVLAVFVQAGEVGLSPQQSMVETLSASTSAYKDYMLNCGGCHRFSGEGVARNAVPDFRNSIGMFTHLPEGREYMIRVPGAAQSLLGNAELAEVLNWIVATYSPAQLAADFKPFTAGEVGAVRPYRFDNVVVERRKLTERLNEQGLTPSAYLYGAN
ncbi:cytochrome C [Castellaniella sp.]|uniref:cytochrome C n=1 Tax=Castellaniella sp. TaxID=1955812 RepID=UPI002AFEE4CC|nr:cytochrome C [Castellaniella sp.]